MGLSVGLYQLLDLAGLDGALQRLAQIQHRPRQAVGAIADLRRKKGLPLLLRHRSIVFGRLRQGRQAEHKETRRDDERTADKPQGPARGSAQPA